MPTSNKALTILWWSGYTILGIWAHRILPGIDFFAPGLILSIQKEEAPTTTILLGIIWILLIEGTGNLPFGYGLACYGLLITLYFMGQWLFESRSFLFMALLGLGLGVLHVLLVSAVSSLAKLTVPTTPLLIEGAMQAGGFIVIWLLADYFYPTRLRRDVTSL